MPLTYPLARPALDRLPPFGKRALVKVLLHIIWGEALSFQVTQFFSRFDDQTLARYAGHQAQEENQHHRFFEKLYKEMTGQTYVSHLGHISRSLQQFGKEVTNCALSHQQIEAMIGLYLLLEGLASILFEKSYPGCAKQWPAGQATLKQIMREEAGHVGFGQVALQQRVRPMASSERRRISQLADHWERLIRRAIREIGWKVFPFPVPVRALQKEFQEFMSQAKAGLGLTVRSEK
ncbi:MAG: hypothetical protein HYZ73_01930 [Elusimicrobia bacterium]|nr:hypothetical protein [Elusimicrobiota bacterium]